MVLDEKNAVRTIFIECHSERLRAYIPARAFSLSTLLMVHRGMVNLTDLRSRLENAKYGGNKWSFPAYIPASRHEDMSYMNSSQ